MEELGIKSLRTVGVKQEPLKEDVGETKSSYRQIMKATSLFGGVQIFRILIAIVRSKVIAVLLGPTGIGIIGLLNSAVELVSSLTSFGLRTSAVKDIALAHKTSNIHRKGIVVTVFNKWVWLTGLLGAILMIILSPWLSEFTFDNQKYTSAFIWLSITLLFNQLSNGQMAVLQGMQKLNYLAKANIYGNLLSLAVSLPLYYIWEVDGIVPALILSSAVSLTLSWHFAKKIKIQKVRVSSLRAFAEGKGMLKLGFFLSLSGLISNATAYGIRIFISHTGGVDDVGFYNAGFQIINTYVGMIFTAMATDYFPRLSGVAKDNVQVKFTVNQQAEIAVLILAPVILVFLVFVDWVIVALYSTKFMEITPMIQWAAIGMFFKAVSWAISFIFLAKGASRLFFLSELAANLYIFICSVIGYYFGGIQGLGISFLVTYIIYLIQAFVIAKIKYQFRFAPQFYKIYGLQLTLAISCFIVVKAFEAPYSYILGLTLIILSALYSYQELNERLGLKEILTTIKNKIFRQ